MDTSIETISQADYVALAKLRFALRRFLNFSASAATEEGLPPQQHQALLAIKGFEGPSPMTTGILAERLLIVPHAATELVGRLIKGGYVERHTDPSDKRRQELCLTGKSEQVLAKLSSIHLKEILEIGSAVKEILENLENRK